MVCRNNGDVEAAARVPYTASKESLSQGRKEGRGAGGRRVLERGLLIIIIIIIIINNVLIKVALSCQRHCRGTVQN